MALDTSIQTLEEELRVIHKRREREDLTGQKRYEESHRNLFLRYRFPGFFSYLEYSPKFHTWIPYPQCDFRTYSAETWKNNKRKEMCEMYEKLHPELCAHFYSEVNHSNLIIAWSTRESADLFLIA
jgi:hypothetical protein